ncbi:major facilitator superfamily MFS_1 (plasmid) [Rhizorhabdus wittichii RW1]|uniref:Major facilitator superfamily MFS_1 n=1 Tax=Rhizorhabdus wittichii (strain DSM 6014 / CCUG 31198 / JCM 15750 / NBRC 105917 / EY 4224 / RW1) TaxID=392499 RepID=A0A9J9LFA5_RHIWR|nr:major facilitator superfamily MFS_1 [Rhizorhabdus wittichii RW1]
MTARGPEQADTEAAGGRWNRPVLAVCTLIALTEGFDLASIGVTGPGLAAELALDKRAFGVSVTAVMLGFFAGATLGGRWGDRVGRRNALIIGMVVAACFSLLTITVTSFGALLLVRVLTGIGIGMVYPNIMALAASCAPRENAASAVAISSSGGSIGSLASGMMLAVGGGALGWRDFFVTGALGTLLLVPFVLAIVPRHISSTPRSEASAPIRAILFGNGMAMTTAAIWTMNFIVSALYYMIGSWLPTLLAARNLPPETIGISLVVLALSAVAGGLLLSTAYDRRPGRGVVLSAFLGMMIAFAWLALARAPSGAMVSVGMIGAFLFGGQMLVYAISALCYPAPVRGAGLGWAHGAGRLGGIVSPLVIGVALQAGIGQQGVLLGAIPLLLIAAAAAAIVARKSAAGARRAGDAAGLTFHNQPIERT